MTRITPLSQRLTVTGVFIALLTGCDGPIAEDLIPIPAPAGTGSAEPHLAVGPGGTVVLSWLEPEADGVALRYSTFIESSWSSPRTVARGTDWFVNWADFPSVSPISETLWAAHWLAKRPGGTYSYDVAMALSTDRGATWSEPLTPHTDGTRTEHGFVSLFPWQNGVGAVWLDGRNMTEDGAAQGAEGTGGGGMTLRAAVVSPASELVREDLVDNLVCDCCQTDVALTTDGPLVVYRNRTTAEIRDIYVARFVTDRWEPGHAVADDDWEISGCPVNGPAIAAQGNDVAVAWFTAAKNQPKVRLARSIDSAATFSPAMDIDAEGALGRVDVALLEDGAAVVSWLRQGSRSQGEVVVQRVATSGVPGPPIVIAETTDTRPSGFPQMVRIGDELLFAWTHNNEVASTVRTARIDVSALVRSGS